MINIAAINDKLEETQRKAIEPFSRVIDEEVRRMCDKYKLEYTVGMGTWFFDSLKRKDRRYDEQELEYLLRNHAPSKEVCADLMNLMEILNTKISGLRYEWAYQTNSYDPRDHRK